MRQRLFDTTVFSDPAWWHWSVTVVLLAGHLMGCPVAIYFAIGLCAAMGVYYAVRLRGLKPLPVQICLAYLLMLVAGLLPAMAWLHWIQLIGTTARVTVGYCATARMLSLAPWNRTKPWTLALTRQVFLAPSTGGLFQLSREEDKPTGACCSLKNRPLPTVSKDSGGA
jgi:hypothetical protein